MKKTLLMSTALVALTAGPALAFDNVDWSWDSKVDMHTIVDPITKMEFFPSGNVQVEKLQIFIGSLDSSATLGTFVNNQPTMGGEAQLNTALNIQGTWDANQTNANLTPTSQTFTPGVGLNATVDTANSKINVSPTAYDITINLEGTVVVPASQSFDAVTQLPEVNVSATSVANIDQISSTVGTYVHEGQFVFNTNPASDVGVANVNGGGNNNGNHGNSGNQFNTGAVFAALSAISGDISPASITSTARADSITNASANVSATAIANLASIDVAPTYDPVALDGFTPATTGDNDRWGHGDHGTPASYPIATDLQLIGDVTQFAYANVRANASLGAMELNNYTNLRQLPAVGAAADVAGVTTGVANVTASALGNVATINVGVKK